MRGEMDVNESVESIESIESVESVGSVEWSAGSLPALSEAKSGYGLSVCGPAESIESVGSTARAAYVVFCLGGATETSPGQAECAAPGKGPLTSKPRNGDRLLAIVQ